MMTLPTYSRWLKRACKRAHASAVTRVSRKVLNMKAEQCCSSEQISERICKQIVDVHVPQVVEQVPKISSQDRNLQGRVEQIPDVLVPEMVKQLVKSPKTESVDRIQQRTAERIVDIPVPKEVEELVEVSKVFPKDRIQQRFVEQNH